MATISLCMIVKNEERVLSRCLDSVAGLVDEMVIVDTGSTDATKAVALAYTDRVYDFVWRDDFASARNYSFSLGKMDYLMWLDADDVLLLADREAFLDLKRGLSPDVDVVMMPYHSGLDGAGRPVFTCYRERVVRNLGRDLWEGVVHEAIAPFGRVIWSKAAVTHQKEGAGDPDRNLRIYEKKLARGEAFSPRERFYYARELLDHRRYADAAKQLEDFLARGGGWVEDEIEACRLLSQCRLAQGDEKGALQALLDSFRYDDPRAETCCALGAYFQARQAWRRAVFWYEMALTRERNDQGGGFIQPDCYGFLPCIQLCVCFDRLGRRREAEAWNQRAGRYKPEDPSYLWNLAYFQSLSLQTPPAP